MEDGKRAIVAGCVSLACQILAECSSSEDEEIADEEALLCAVALQKYRTKDHKLLEPDQPPAKETNSRIQIVSCVSEMDQPSLKTKRSAKQ